MEPLDDDELEFCLDINQMIDQHLRSSNDPNRFKRHLQLHKIRKKQRLIDEEMSNLESLRRRNELELQMIEDKKNELQRQQREHQQRCERLEIENKHQSNPVNTPVPDHIVNQYVGAINQLTGQVAFKDNEIKHLQSLLQAKVNEVLKIQDIHRKFVGDMQKMQFRMQTIGVKKQHALGILEALKQTQGLPSLNNIQKLYNIINDI